MARAIIHSQREGEGEGEDVAPGMQVVQPEEPATWFSTLSASMTGIAYGSANFVSTLTRKVDEVIRRSKPIVGETEGNNTKYKTLGGFLNCQSTGADTFNLIPKEKFTGVVVVQRKKSNGELDPSNVDRVVFENGKTVYVLRGNDSLGASRVNNLDELIAEEQTAQRSTAARGSHTPPPIFGYPRPPAIPTLPAVSHPEAAESVALKQQLAEAQSRIVALEAEKADYQAKEDRDKARLQKIAADVRIVMATTKARLAADKARQLEIERTRQAPAESAISAATARLRDILDRIKQPQSASAVTSDAVPVDKSVNAAVPATPLTRMDKAARDTAMKDITDQLAAVEGVAGSTAKNTQQGQHWQKRRVILQAKRAIAAEKADLNRKMASELLAKTELDAQIILLKAQNAAETNAEKKQTLEHQITELETLSLNTMKLKREIDSKDIEIATWQDLEVRLDKVVAGSPTVGVTQTSPTTLTPSPTPRDGALGPILGISGP